MGVVNHINCLVHVIIKHGDINNNNNTMYNSIVL